MPPADDRSSLEETKERLYKRDPIAPARVEGSYTPKPTFLPHAWKETLLPPTLTGGKRHVRLATLFFGAAIIFFVVSLSVAGYFFYFGGNSVSPNKITVTLQGPTTIAGGDIVPLSLSITNRNPVSLANAVVDITFPAGTREAENILTPYPRFSEELGTIPSGVTITRSIKAVVFGAAGQTLTLPINFTYSAVGTNAVFVKKSQYELAISTTPLSISIDTASEVVAGNPFTLTLNVRSNATSPIENVMVAGVFPFGFNVTSSSLPLTNSGFFVGKLEPGGSKTITIKGVLQGQTSEERVFHFTVGTAPSPSDALVAYMTQDASVRLAAPFIATTLAINGDTSSNVSISPGSTQSVTVSYTNTLPTTVTNASVSVKISGSGVDYGSIRTSNGFYDSNSRTIRFDRDTDSAFESLAPGASGVGSFTFSALPSTRGGSPSITFTTAVSGTRVGQTSVPEEISSTMTKTVKVVANVALVATALHSSGALSNSGPIPPRVGEATTYGVVWGVQNSGSAVAGGTVTTVLPSYVTYTGVTTGGGSFSYDSSARKVTWSAGDLSQGGSASGAFQVSITPSSSQQGTSPVLTGPATFSGYDRFAAVQVSATADAVTTDTGSEDGSVQ
jgi:hypothetical protein